MSKTKRNTERAQYEQAVKATREHAKYERETAKTLGITVAEVRERIKQSREAHAREEVERKAKEKRESIAFLLGGMQLDLSCIGDLAECTRRGGADMVSESTILRAIEAIGDKCSESFDELCKRLEIEPKSDRIDDAGGDRG